MKEVLLAVPIDVDSTADRKHQSMFILDTAYAHTMNQVLFHSGAELTHANVRTCICPSMENKSGTPEAAKMKIKDMTLFGPLSLKDSRSYVEVDYIRSGSGDKAVWELSNVQYSTF